MLKKKVIIWLFIAGLSLLCCSCAKLTREDENRKEGIFLTFECDKMVYFVGWRGDSDSGGVFSVDGSPYRNGECITIDLLQKDTMEYTITLYDKKGDPLADADFKHEFKENKRVYLIATKDLKIRYK